jgi:hypothetical protein
MLMPAVGSSNIPPAAKRDRVENGAGPRDQVPARHPRPDHVVVHAAGRLHGEAHILLDAQVRKQVGELEGAAEAGAGAQRRGKSGDIGAVEQDAAAGRTELPGDQVEVGGLAGAVGADNGGQLTGTEAAADRVDRDVAAEANGQIAGFET